MVELNDYLETDEVTKREYYQKVDENDKAKDREIKKLKDKLHLLDGRLTKSARNNMDLKYELTKKDKEIEELKDYVENTANLIDELTECSLCTNKELDIKVLKKEQKIKNLEFQLKLSNEYISAIQKEYAYEIHSLAEEIVEEIKQKGQNQIMPVFKPPYLTTIVTISLEDLESVIKKFAGKK